MKYFLFACLIVYNIREPTYFYSIEKDRALNNLLKKGANS